ncbi:hypothetical protein SK128_022093, partial [Halocaridina rubra]
TYLRAITSGLPGMREEKLILYSKHRKAAAILGLRRHLATTKGGCKRETVRGGGDIGEGWRTQGERTHSVREKRRGATPSVIFYANFDMYSNTTDEGGVYLRPLSHQSGTSHVARHLMTNIQEYMKPFIQKWRNRFHVQHGTCHATSV